MAENSPVTGVSEEDFTDDVWHGIATAYFRSALQLPGTEEVLPDRWYHRTATQILGGGGEYRFGSLITMHSKLLICNWTRGKLHFNFYDNADSHELKWAQSCGITPETIQNDFQNRVALFLGELGLAQEISTCVDIR